MEALGQLLCQDRVPAGEHKKHDKEHPRSGQGKLPIGIQLAQVRG